MQGGNLVHSSAAFAFSKVLVLVRYKPTIDKGAKTIHLLLSANHLKLKSVLFGFLILKDLMLAFLFKCILKRRSSAGNSV